jgi:hypothetical protein
MSNIKVFRSHMVATRARTICNLTAQGSYLRALKIIRLTIVNLETAHVPDMSGDAIRRCIMLLNGAAMYANRYVKEPILEFMNDIIDECDAANITLETLPHVVRSAIAFVF